MTQKRREKKKSQIGLLTNKNLKVFSIDNME